MVDCPSLAETAQGQQEMKQLDEHVNAQLEDARRCWPQAYWIARESMAGIILVDIQSRYNLGSRSVVEFSGTCTWILVRRETCQSSS